MGEREDVLADLRERAQYYASLTSLGFPPRASVSAPGRPMAPERGQPAMGGRPAPAAAMPDSARSVLASPAGRLGATPSLSEGPPDLEGIKTWIGDCQRCKLAKGRKTIVYGQGNPKAELMFVGEGPGADEDEQGLAFVGRAGQLLTDIIEKGMKMRREDVFIANVIKCRPPQNRNPEPDEVLACQPFLERQIEVIKPKVLVGLGKFGGQWLLKTAEPISRIRGRIGEYRSSKVVPTWHPAYLLRNPGAKKDVWEDMKLVLRLLREE